jgi:broad specificity phosphatase PhoE
MAVSAVADAGTAALLRPIMLIRHAEDDQGSPSLSARGWQRAGALVRLFAPLDPASLRKHLAVPRHIVAARSRDDSTRPLDTVQPLAELLGLPVDDSLSSDDPAVKVAQALRALDAPVLVCWRHDTLPALAEALLQRAGETPPGWPADRHDVVWVIERGGASAHLVQVPQQLLPGDRTQSIVRRVRRAA